jgi:diguanylate cyclase (GGDEF)-like protein
VTDTRTAQRRQLQVSRRADLKLSALIAAVLATATGLVIFRVPSLPQTIDVPGHPAVLFLILVGGFVVAERANVYLPIGRNAYSLALNEIPLVVGLFLVPPTHYVAARVIGSAIPLVLRNRRSMRKLAFNLSQYALEGAAVVVLWRLVLGDASPLSPWGWLAIAVAVVATDALATVLIALAIAATSGDRVKLTAEVFGLGPVLPLVNTSFALVLVYVIRADWRAVWTLAVVVAVLYFAQRAHHSLGRRTQSLEQLSKFTGEIGGHLDVGSAASSAVVWICRTLNAEVAELTLCPEFAGTQRQWEGRYDGSTSEPSTPVRSRALASWLSPGPLLVRRNVKDPALADALRLAGLREVVAMPLQGDEGVIGTLLVGDRLGDVETFDPSDLRELQALGNHLSVALRNARRADLIGEQAREALHRSLHDSLTGLPNRRSLEDSFNERLATSVRLSLVLLNLDRFKEINDTLGHRSGDALLTMVAGRLRRSLPEDAVLARVGGDEFAVLLTGSGELAVHAVVTLLRQALSVPFELDDLHVTVGASFGIAHSESTAAAIDVLRRSDVAMAVAKEHRTGVETYRPDLDASSRERLTLLTDLKQAIVDGSLTVHVQPQVRLRDGQVTGVEALARWIHPVRGFIAPDDFIAVAEHSGLIKPLTMSVLRQSLAACESWRRGGWSLGVAVNVSPRSLLDPEFVDDVARALAAVEVPAAALTLEITETSLMADPEHAIGALARLRGLGVRLSIDDLGTGYSSLAYLQRLPVHELKIDKSFLLRADMAAHDESVDIIGAIVDLGHRLGREVVAEGVEDETSWHTLQSLGCDIAQGYWMSRPMPPGDLVGWLESWRPHAVAPLRAVR